MKAFINTTDKGFFESRDNQPTPEPPSPPGQKEQLWLQVPRDGPAKVAHRVNLLQAVTKE